MIFYVDACFDAFFLIKFICVQIVSCQLFVLGVLWFSHPSYYQSHSLNEQHHVKTVHEIFVIALPKKNRAFFWHVKDKFVRKRYRWQIPVTTMHTNFPLFFSFSFIYIFFISTFFPFSFARSGLPYYIGILTFWKRIVFAWSCSNTKLSLLSCQDITAIYIQLYLWPNNVVWGHSLGTAHKVQCLE